DEPDYVANVTLEQLVGSSGFRTTLDDSSLAGLAIGDRSFMEWRLSKPKHAYRNYSSFIVKEFGSQEDIVAINNLPNAGHSETGRYNILLDASVTDLRGYEVFPYQFGY